LSTGSIPPSYLGPAETKGSGPQRLDIATGP
jgi:hypothetical protein